jgi:hypothetical protein
MSRFRVVNVIRETRPLSFKVTLITLFYLTINQRSIDLNNRTESAFTTKLDNLIELYQLSSLQTAYYLRYTETGFIIRESRLLNCVVLPTEKILRRL